MQDRRKYAFMVSASLPYYYTGLTALLNSIEEHGDQDTEVVILTCGEKYPLPKVSYPVRMFTSSKEHNHIEMIVGRFARFAKWGRDYDAICVLDADMYLTANVSLFFRLAEAGFIVTGSNGMIIDFDDKYQVKAGVLLGYGHWPYTKTHTTVPVFLGRSDLDWLEEVYRSWHSDGIDDCLLLNILGIKMEKYKRMVCMPPYAFTGIHHWQMKPETAVFEKAGILLSGTEEQVYMVHGKWWDEKWLEALMPTMEKYFADEGINGKGTRKTREAIDLLKAKFDNYLRGEFRQ